MDCFVSYEKFADKFNDENIYYNIRFYLSNGVK